MKFQINFMYLFNTQHIISHNLSKDQQHMYNTQVRMMYPVLMVGSFYHHGKYMNMKRWYIKIYDALE
jgi:hypothetical protein